MWVVKDAFWIDYSGPGEKARYSPPSLRRDSRRSPQVAETGREPAEDSAREKRSSAEPTAMSWAGRLPGWTWQNHTFLRLPVVDEDSR